MGMKTAGATLFYKGGLLGGTKYIGLIDTSDSELSGDAYARVAMAGFGGSDSWQLDGEEYENRESVAFPSPTGAWSAIGKWGLYSALTSGELLADVDIDPDTAAPQTAADVSAAMQTLGIGFTGVTPAGSLKGMNEGLLSGTRYVTLHSGNPGTAGASFVGALRAQVAESAWNLDDNASNRRARNGSVISFGSQASNLGAVTWVALRDGAGANAAVLFSTSFSSVDPAAGDTISFGARAISVLLPVD